MGTFLHLPVSADGSIFFDGLSVDNATGIVDQPRLPRFKAYTNYDNNVGVGTWTKIGILRFPNQVRHPVYPGTLWERDTTTSRLKSGAA